MQTFSGHRDRVVAVAFSPDGKTVMSNIDRTIKLWNLEHHELLATLLGHSDWVLTAVPSRDGRSLVTGGKDTVIAVWRR